MSTKQSIKYMEDNFHLYTDVIDSLKDNPMPVYLELTGCDYEAVSWDGGSRLTVRIPREIAVELGLILPDQP